VASSQVTALRLTGPVGSPQGAERGPGEPRTRQHPARSRPAAPLASTCTRAPAHPPHGPLSAAQALPSPDARPRPGMRLSDRHSAPWRPFRPAPVCAAGLAPAAVPLELARPAGLGEDQALSTAPARPARGQLADGGDGGCHPGQVRPRAGKRAHGAALADARPGPPSSTAPASSPRSGPALSSARPGAGRPGPVTAGHRETGRAPHTGEWYRRPEAGFRYPFAQPHKCVSAQILMRIHSFTHVRIYVNGCALISANAVSTMPERRS
jgi:hypothetical protein